MRFAWQRKNSGSQVSVKQNSTGQLIFVTYNIVYWLPIILPFTRAIDYNAGFISFFALVVVRAVANLYRNNVLKPEQAEFFPLRSI